MTQPWIEPMTLACEASTLTTRLSATSYQQQGQRVWLPLQNSSTFVSTATRSQGVAFPTTSTVTTRALVFAKVPTHQRRRIVAGSRLGGTAVYAGHSCCHGHNGEKKEKRYQVVYFLPFCRGFFFFICVIHSCSYIILQPHVLIVRCILAIIHY